MPTTSTHKQILSPVSYQNMLLFPATVEGNGDFNFLVYCSNGASRSYLHDKFGFILSFRTFEAAQHFIKSF